MVFYRVVRASFQVMRDLSPLVLAVPIQEVEDELLFLAPIGLFYPGIEMVMPALTTLLTDPAG